MPISNSQMKERKERWMNEWMKICILFHINNSYNKNSHSNQHHKNKQLFSCTRFKINSYFSYFSNFPGGIDFESSAWKKKKGGGEKKTQKN